jgi:hypothetical protein
LTAITGEETQGMFENLTERLDEGIREIMLFLPRLAAALGTLMVGLFVAKMVERGTDLLLHRIGFDRWMREGGVTEALERAGTHLDPSTVIAKLVFWTVMLLVILASAMVLGVTAVNMLFAELLAYIPKVIAAVVVLVIGILIGEFIKDLVLASAGGIQAGPTLARLAKASIVLLAVFMALEQLEIAQEVVLVFFIGVVGAAALAAGIAFGLGGRDVAALIAREWYERSRGHPTRRPGSSPSPASTTSPPFPETPPGERRE